jgi:hypothetical protein
MENELRSSARNGLILRKDEALKHLTEARCHFEEALNGATDRKRSCAGKANSRARLECRTWGKRSSHRL